MEKDPTKIKSVVIEFKGAPQLHPLESPTLSALKKLVVEVPATCNSKASDIRYALWLRELLGRYCIPPIYYATGAMPMSTQRLASNVLAGMNVHEEIGKFLSSDKHEEGTGEELEEMEEMEGGEIAVKGGSEGSDRAEKTLEAGKKRRAGDHLIELAPSRWHTI